MDLLFVSLLFNLPLTSLFNLPLNPFHIGNKQALNFFGCFKVAEDLYQAGFISYPRTETDCFSQRTDLHVGICFGDGLHYQSHWHLFLT